MYWVPCAPYYFDEQVTVYSLKMTVLQYQQTVWSNKKRMTHLNECGNKVTYVI